MASALLSWTDQSGEGSNHVMRALRKLVERATREGPEASCPSPAPRECTILEADLLVQPSLQVKAAQAYVLIVTS